MTFFNLLYNICKRVMLFILKADQFKIQKSQLFKTFKYWLIS